MIWLRRLVGILGVVLLSLVSSGPVLASNTQQSTLGQSVEPITCVYTITALGGSTSSSTDCDSIIAPTLDTVEPRAGRPYLAGTLTPTDLAMFRVWVGGTWFTSGVSSNLTVSAGTWELDLAALATALEVGEYTIVLEELTTSDFLLRSVYLGALYIPVIDVVRTDTLVGNGTTSHYTATERLGVAMRDRSLELSLVPDERLIDRSWGFSYYTMDVVVKKEFTLAQMASRTLVALMGVALVYWVYVYYFRGRSG